VNLYNTAVFSLLSFALSCPCALLSRALACASAALLLSLLALPDFMLALYQAVYICNKVAAVNEEIHRSREEAQCKALEAA